MTNDKRLKQLVKNLEKDARQLPLVSAADEIVPPEGNPDAELMFIGEAAGLHELEARRPFVGAAGKLLTERLREHGIERRDIWISNMVKARPPGNREPVREEIEAYRPYLDEEIEIIRPKVIVTLGRVSLIKFIPDAYVSRVHGQARWVTWKDRRLLIFPMYHPAAALRSNDVMRQMNEDFDRLVTLLEMLKNDSTSQESEEERRKGTSSEEKDNQQLQLL